MNEFHIIYRHEDVYKIIDSIYSEETANTILDLLLQAGYEDSRVIEVLEYEGGYNYARF